MHLRTPGDRLQQDAGEEQWPLPQKVGQQLRLTQTSRENHRQGPRGPCPLWGRFPPFFSNIKCSELQSTPVCPFVGPRAEGRGTLRPDQ